MYEKVTDTGDDCFSADQMRKVAAIAATHRDADSVAQVNMLTPRMVAGIKTRIHNKADKARRKCTYSRMIKESEPEHLLRACMYKASLELSPRGFSFAGPYIYEKPVYTCCLFNTTTKYVSLDIGW